MVKRKELYDSNNILDRMNDLYTSKNPLVRFAHVNRLNRIVSMIPLTPKLKVLDAGCGEGHLIETLHQKNGLNLYYGIDVTKLFIHKAKKRCPYAQLQQSSLLEINFDDEFFDIVICTEVLEHIFRYKQVLSELKRVLKRRGYLIITFPNEVNWTIGRFFLGRRPTKVREHVNSFTPNKMKSLIDMKLVNSKGIPFGLPFVISTNYLMKFKKE